MTTPIFDANGWCHDMEHPEARAEYVDLWMSTPGGEGGYERGRWWAPPDGRRSGWYGMRDECLEGWGFRATAWRPLPPPPVSDS